MDDPYTVLGVARDASADDIRTVYRKFAKQDHPGLMLAYDLPDARPRTSEAAAWPRASGVSWSSVPNAAAIQN